MDRSLMTVANVRYQSSKGQAFGKVRDLSRYFQYRQDRDKHIPQERGVARWVDHGLGDNFRQIAENCEAYKSEHVQAFFLVINPNPDLMAFLPEEQQEAFVKELTEATIEHFFEQRGLDTPEYSYAYHVRETRDANQPGRVNPHTHVILPGTYESWADGGRLPLYMNRNQRENHIELLHQVSQEQMGQLLDRYVGVDWEQRYDALMPPPEQPTPDQPAQRQAFVFPDDFNWHIHRPDIPAHTLQPDEQGHPTEIWLASHPDLFTETYHLGFILRQQAAEEVSQEFMPRITHLSQTEMDELSDYLLHVLSQEGGWQKAWEFTAWVGRMSEAERAAMFAEVHAGAEAALHLQDHSPSLDIDF